MTNCHAILFLFCLDENESQEASAADLLELYDRQMQG